MTRPVPRATRAKAPKSWATLGVEAVERMGGVNLLLIRVIDYVTKRMRHIALSAEQMPERPTRDQAFTDAGARLRQL